MRRRDFWGGMFLRFAQRLGIIRCMADVTDEFYASQGWIGYGTQFEVGQGDSPETFVAVGEVTSIDKLVELTTDVKEVTHLRSEDATKEKIAALSDASAVRISGTFVPGRGEHLEAGGDGFLTGHSLVALRKSRARNNFRFVLADEAGLEGSPATAISIPLVGIVTRYMVGPLSTEDKVGFEVEITPVRAYYNR